jgi:hypothetical protein
MPKRGSASSSAPTKRTKGEEEYVHVCRWARCTDVDSLDHDKIHEVEWAGGDLSEIHACIKEELDSVLGDEQGTHGAFLSRERALKARDELMAHKIAEAKEGVRRAYGLSVAQWNKLLKTDWVCEYSDTRKFGAEYKGPGQPTPQQDLATRWARQSSAIEAAAAAFTFQDAKHNSNDESQAHYELAWGSPGGCGVVQSEENEVIECCETILTRIRCWVEHVPLKD